MTIAIPSSESFLLQLANPAGRAILLASAAAFVLAAFRVKATSARLFAWKTVLCAALAMPLLGWMLPAVTIPIPKAVRFSNQTLAAPAVSNTFESHSFKPPTVTPERRTQSTLARSEPAQPGWPAAGTKRPSAPPLQWTAIAASIYLLVAILLLGRIVIGLFLGRRLLRAAKQIFGPRLEMSLCRCARLFGLAAIPDCAEAEIIAVPVTIGVLHPTIILPANWREWDDAKLNAVLAHEVSHVARRDALTQTLSLLHRAIFWFSPLAWWLDRHLADLAEQASDEAALLCGADSNDYARALLGFFETLHAAPGRVWWQGIAIAKSGQAERRLERILGWKDNIRSSKYEPE